MRQVLCNVLQTYLNSSLPSDRIYLTVLHGDDIARWDTILHGAAVAPQPAWLKIHSGLTHAIYMYQIDMICVSSDTDTFCGSCTKLSTIYIIKLPNYLYNKTQQLTHCSLELLDGNHGDSYTLFAAKCIRTWNDLISYLTLPHVLLQQKRNVWLHLQPFTQP